MYCNKCGRPNPDGSTFCSGCGTVLNVPAPAQAAPQQPLSVPAVQEDAFDLQFRSSWRTLVSSTLCLVLVIIYSVLQLLSMMDLSSSLESVYSTLDLIDSFSSADSGLFGGLNSTLTVIQLLIAAPGILLTIGMWMLYTDARKDSDAPISTAGLSLIRGVLIGQLVVFCTNALILLFAACSAWDATSQYYARESLTIIIFVLILVSVLFVLYYRLLINLTASIRACAQWCCPDTAHIMPTVVILFVSGSLSAIGVLITGISLTSVLSCAVPFLVGAVLLKYQELMQTLEVVYYAQGHNATSVQSPSQPIQPTGSSQNIPTWKRIEMEKERAQHHTQQDT